MKLSTLVELAGFTAITVAAWRLNVEAGLFTLGVCLLFVGYATEDAAAAVAMSRVVDPLRARRAARKSKKAAAKAAKSPKE